MIIIENKMKKFFLILWVLLIFIDYIICDKIHYTNLRNRFNKNVANRTTYQIVLPVSEKITLIETQGLVNTTSSSHDAATDEENDDRDYVSKDDLIKNSNDLHRRLHLNSGSSWNKSGSRLEKSNNRRNSYHTVTSTTTSPKKPNYSPELIKKFLSKFPVDRNDEIFSDPSFQDKLNEIAKLSYQITTEPTLDDNDDEDLVQAQNTNINAAEEKYASHYNDNRYNKFQNANNNPYNDKNGWVTLDAIPWSTSKVSKWHPNKNINQRPTYGHVQPVSPNWPDDLSSVPYQPSRPPHPQNNFDPFSDDDYRPVHGYRPPKPSYSYDTETPSKPSWSSFADNRPHTYGQKPNTDYYTHRPPAYSYGYSDNNYSPSNNYDSQYKPSHWNEDIITDGQPSRFPEKQSYQPRPQPPSPTPPPHSYYNQHPSSYPSNGNGEWVLISTTKGYHFPTKYGKRAIALTNSDSSASASQQQSSITAASTSSNVQSVQISVLPKGGMNSTNTTTSHDGIIEVDASNESVEESVMTTTLSPTTTKKPKQVKLRRKKLTRKKIPLSSRQKDSTAVLAAVGAGMVPATVAMLMPMVMGR